MEQLFIWCTKFSTKILLYVDASVLEKLLMKRERNKLNVMSQKLEIIFFEVPLCNASIDYFPFASLSITGKSEKISLNFELQRVFRYLFQVK